VFFDEAIEIKNFYIQLMEEIGSLDSEVFFEQTAERLANHLGVKTIQITECCDNPPSRVRSLAFGIRVSLQIA
jgi:hypothetical protein